MSTADRGRKAILFSAIIFVGIYILACTLVYRDFRTQDLMTTEPVTMQEAKNVEAHPILQSGGVCRKLAEKLPYYAHDPGTVERLFSLAMRKNPADYQPFLGYAYYLASRRSPSARVHQLFQETIRRCPTDPDVQRLAAAQFLSTGELQKALPFFKKAIELKPELAHKLYLTLEENHQPVSTLIAVTPDTTGGLLELSDYLSGRKQDAEVHRIVRVLTGRKLDSDQRLRLATIAMSAGMIQVAQEQGEITARDPEKRLDASRFMAQVAWERDDWPAFQKIAESIQQQYISQDETERAADYACSVVTLLSSRGRSSEAKQYLLQTLNRYPRYAPAYFQMASLSSSSPRVFIYYLEKACQLDEDNVEFHFILASAYLNNSRIPDAVKVYGKLLQWPEYQERAYLGLSDCEKARSGNLQAIIFIEQAMERIGRTKGLLFRLGQLYSSYGEYEKTIKTLTEYIQKYGSDSTAYYMIGDAYNRMGQSANAKENFALALETNPQDTAAQQALAALAPVP